MRQLATLLLFCTGICLSEVAVPWDVKVCKVPSRNIQCLEKRKESTLFPSHSVT